MIDYEEQTEKQVDQQVEQEVREVVIDGQTREERIIINIGLQIFDHLSTIVKQAISQHRSIVVKQLKLNQMQRADTFERKMNQSFLNIQNKILKF